MRTLTLALLLGAVIAMPNRAGAEGAPVQAGGYTDFGCQAAPPGGSGCGGITRPSNTTQYTANTAVCASPCAALQIVAGRQPNGDSRGTGVLSKIVLAKSGSSTTSATFKVFLYSAPPTLTSITDNAGYTGPFLADIIGSGQPGGSFVGSASCATAQTTTDSAVWFDCTLDGNGNFLAYKTTNNLLYAMIEVTGTYTPASAEKFYVVTYELQD